MHNTVLGILSNCKRFVDQGKVFSALLTDLSIAQKQPFRGVLKKRCSENIQQIYRRPIPSPCDVIGGERRLGSRRAIHPSVNFFWNRILPGMFSRKFALASFFKTSKAFLTPKLPELRRRSWLHSHFNFIVLSG